MLDMREIATSFGTHAKAFIMIHPLVICFVHKHFINFLPWYHNEAKFIGFLLNNHLILKISFQYIKYFQIFQKMQIFKRWIKV
jgi:hypothetical protein